MSFKIKSRNVYYIIYLDESADCELASEPALPIEIFREKVVIINLIFSCHLDDLQGYYYQYDAIIIR